MLPTAIASWLKYPSYNPAIALQKVPIPLDKKLKDKVSPKR